MDRQRVGVGADGRGEVERMASESGITMRSGGWGTVRGGRAGSPAGGGGRITSHDMRTISAITITVTREHDEDTEPLTWSNVRTRYTPLSAR